MAAVDVLHLNSDEGTDNVNEHPI